MNSDRMDTHGIEEDAVVAGRHSSKRWRLATAIFAILAAAALAFAITGFVQDKQAAQSDEQSARDATRVVTDSATDFADQVLEVCKSGGEEAKPLKEAGLCGSATKTKKQVKEVVSALPGPPGPPGPPGSPGLRGLRGLPGGPGIDGDDGKSGVNGQQGLAGLSIKGDTGAVGQQGGVGKTGPAGPPGGEGKTGATGKTGLTGLTGRGIKSVDCNPEGRFLIHYTDNTQQVVSNSTCRILAPAA